MLQEGREIGADDVMADRHGDAPLLLREGGEGLLLRRDQLTRGSEEVRTVGREADEARRAIEQAATQCLFQAPNLQADGRLARIQGRGRARETREVGHQHEGLDRCRIQHQSYLFVISETSNHLFLL